MRGMNSVFQISMIKEAYPRIILLAFTLYDGTDRDMININGMNGFIRRPNIILKLVRINIITEKYGIIPVI